VAAIAFPGKIETTGTPLVSLMVAATSEIRVVEVDFASKDHCLITSKSTRDRFAITTSNAGRDDATGVVNITDAIGLVVELDKVIPVSINVERSIVSEKDSVMALLVRSRPNDTNEGGMELVVTDVACNALRCGMASI